VRIVSEDMAKLPLDVYRRVARGKERANDHWLQALFDAPNPWQTGFEFRELMQAHVELAGNAYAIKTVVRNETRELLPVSPTACASSCSPISGSCSTTSRCRTARRSPCRPIGCSI
jgi:phage portal protein BeeE